MGVIGLFRKCKFHCHFRVFVFSVIIYFIFIFMIGPTFLDHYGQKSRWMYCLKFCEFGQKDKFPWSLSISILLCFFTFPVSHCFCNCSSSLFFCMVYYLFIWIHLDWVHWVLLSFIGSCMDWHVRFGWPWGLLNDFSYLHWGRLIELGILSVLK